MSFSIWANVQKKYFCGESPVPLHGHFIYGCIVLKHRLREPAGWNNCSVQLSVSQLQRVKGWTEQREYSSGLWQKLLPAGQQMKWRVSSYQSLPGNCLKEENWLNTTSSKSWKWKAIMRWLPWKQEPFGKEVAQLPWKGRRLNDQSGMRNISLPALRTLLAPNQLEGHQSM